MSERGEVEMSFGFFFSIFFFFLTQDATHSVTHKWSEERQRERRREKVGGGGRGKGQTSPAINRNFPLQRCHGNSFNTAATRPMSEQLPGCCVFIGCGLKQHRYLEKKEKKKGKKEEEQNKQNSQTSIGDVLWGPLTR